MKVLIYVASSLANPQFGIQMEKAIEYSKNGDDVVLCYCDGIMSACAVNLERNKALCEICKMGFFSGFKNIPTSVKRISLKTKTFNNEYKWKDFHSIAEIKAYYYKGVESGFSVLSPIITKTKNPNPQISSYFLSIINQILKENEYLIDEVENIILEEKPDLIIFFNGRDFDTKPFYNLAKKHKINFIATENVGGVRADTEYKMVEFYNHIPHDAQVAYENILKSWEVSPKTEHEKINIGTSFYEKRRKGVQAGDYVYTNNQVSGVLPEGYDAQKKNVVIFSSSEHEYSSVSKKVDDYFLFNSQYEGIKYLAENINDDTYHFYVRIHPNMKGLDVEYHRNLYKLCDYPNVTVLAPEDKISSYTLLDIAYNVVVFGSTIGAEALYWEKSVVLLGFASYYYWEVCSIPHTSEEMIRMVKDPQVYPRAKEIAIKYGYFFLENSLAKNTKYIPITPHKITLLGKNIYVFKYLSILGSPVLFKLIRLFYTRVLTLLKRDRIKIAEL